MKKIIAYTTLVLSLILGLVLFVPSTKATNVDECNEVFTYTKSDDFSDARVNINFESNDNQIDVSAQSGYQITEVSLEVSDDGHSGFYLYATGSVNNFNPNPGTVIQVAKIKVKKVCASATPTASPSATPVVTATPSASPSPSSTPSESPVPSETPTPSETPEATPSSTPTPEVMVETPLTEAGVSACDATAPAKVPNIFVTNAGVGKLEVRWIPTGGNKAHIVYGLEAGKPLFSLIDTPNDGVEVIGNLVSGKHYWFAVTNGDGCAWSQLSNWYDPIVL